MEGADTLILGKPVDEGSAFSLEALERLADDIERETGVKVRVFLCSVRRFPPLTRSRVLRKLQQRGCGGCERGLF